MIANCGKSIVAAKFNFEGERGTIIWQLHISIKLLPVYILCG